MELKLCRNCVYWKRNEPYEIGEANFGECSSTKFVYTGGCENVETHNDGLNYWDSEGYRAGFETGENFGCVHFKERE